ncbi:MAG TPA: LuxR C-terminal-related transcriptional regulator [Caulobacteraceae bacterium]|nr:LuxR C-terminal-related transcriptional regulator [Caulobacteraceae bacterium]
MVLRSVGVDREPAGKALAGLALGAPRWADVEIPQPAVHDRRRAAVAALASLRRGRSGDLTRPMRRTLAAAWASVRAFRIDDGLAAANRLEPLLADLAESAATAARSELDVLRATALAAADAPAAALAFARRAIGGASPGPAGPLAAMVIRFAFWRAGDLEGFHAQGRPSLSAPQCRRGRLCIAFDRAVEAAWEAQQLRFATSRRLAEDALEIADGACARPNPAGLLAAAVLAEVAYEAGDMEAARRLLEPCLSRLRTHASADSAARIYPLAARLAAARGELQFAVMLLREGEQLGERRNWPRLIAACLQERVGLYLADGRSVDAGDCADRLSLLAAQAPATAHLNELTTAAVLASCRVALAAEPGRDVVARLRQLHHDAVARDDLHLAVRVSVRLAEALAAVGDAAEAAVVLARGLAVAADTGLYQTFLDGGARVGELVAELSAAPGHACRIDAYADHLARHWPRAERAAQASQRSSGPLSARECAILRLMSRGFSNKQVGRELGIAFETVKTHAKNIYGKLDAANRAEAVARAERLGLI